MEDEESLPFVNMERRSITGNIHQLGNIVRKENGKKNNTYLPWSKNSIERLMISSSVIILLSSSATCPRSSFDPLEATGKSKIGLKYRFLKKNSHNFIFKTLHHEWTTVMSLSWVCQAIGETQHFLVRLTINGVLCIKVSSPLHFIWGHNQKANS